VSRTPIGFHALPSANAAQNPLTIQQVFSAVFCLPCQKAGRENCKAPLSLEFLRFLGADDAALLTQGKKDKHKKTKKNG